MEPNFLPLDNTYNVLALLQKGYTFIETDTSAGTNSSFIVGIPHTAPPKDKEAQLLSQLLVHVPQVTLGVDRRYFDNQA